MWLDVSHLHRFYQSPLGKLTQRILLQRVRRNWPDLTGQRVLSIGYGVPYMRHIKDRAERTLATMPESQGVIRWPPNERNLAVLADERKLPFPDNSMDRVLLVHAIEFTEHLRPMLRETWRVLASGGRLLVVAPNRRGVWARIEGTPFGHGQPYSQSQLNRLLRDNLFLPTQADTALYAPPSNRRMMRRLSPAWERLGRRWLRPFSGVVLMEAEKQVYAASSRKAGQEASRAKIRPALNGLAYPATDSPPCIGNSAANKKTP